MIRRHAAGVLQLIKQHDHGLLAGKLAQRFGNAQFIRPDPWESTVLATSIHDCGWPLHDDQPTLNAEGLPLDVFEVGRSISLNVWTASADRVAARDAYAGLLTSLHVLGLSVYAMSQSQLRYAPDSTDGRRDQFAISRFQHQEIERQQHLRRAVGLASDVPLTHGLGRPHTSAAEDRLLFNFRVLQAMDLMSLAICCTAPPVEQSGELHTAPGGPAVHLRWTRPSPEELVVEPWPFDTPEPLSFEVPMRQLAAGRFTDVQTFRGAVAEAPVRLLAIHIRPWRT